MSLAGKPAQHLIFPDPLLKGRANVFSVTSEAGAYPGPVSAASSNLGRMVPLQAGRLTDLAVDVQYRLVASGGLDAAEFVWREDGATDWLGADDARRIVRFHAPAPLTSATGSDNCATVYSTVYRRLLAFNVDDATDTVTVASRDVDVTRYDEWSTLATFVLDQAIASGHHSLAAIELVDGTIAIVVRTDTGGTPANDFDVYHSSDGATWTRVAADVVRRFTPDGVFATHDTDVAIKLARSGEWIHLAYVDTSATIRVWASSDRMMSWRDTTTNYVATDNGDPDDPVAYDIVGVDDRGSFLLAYSIDTGSDEIRHRPAFQDGPYELVFNSDSLVPTAGPVKAIKLLRTPSHVYEFVWYSDDAVGTADHWQIRRVVPARYQDWSNAWETSDGPHGDWGDPIYNWGRLAAAWTGAEAFFFGARKDVATGTDINQGGAFYWAGWTERSYGDAGPNEPFDSLTAILQEHSWATVHGRPSAGASSPWTEVVAGGATTVSDTQDGLAIASTAAAATRYYEQLITAGTGRPWGFERGFTAGWYVRLGTGDGSQADDTCHVHFTSSNNAGTASWSASMRHGPAGITLHDLVAATDLLSIASDVDGAFTEVRLTVERSTQIPYIAAWDSSLKTWTVSGAGAAFTDGGAVANKIIRIGMSGAPSASDQTWREFWIGDNDMNQQDLFDVGNPAAQFGAVAVPGERYYVEHGLQVGWSGAGGAIGDEWDGSIAHRHAIENVLIDSPRIQWRSGGANPQASQTIILDAGTDRRFAHDACALFGINDREVAVDYDDNSAFSSPSFGGTVTGARFGGSAFTVASVDGVTVTLSSASSWFVVGELAGCYVRALNGAAAGTTWRVTRHDRLLLFHVDDEVTDLATQGLAASDLVDFYCDHGSVLYATPPPPSQFMRLRLTQADTAESDHRIGSLVAGPDLTIDVPLDWAFTDNEQPNVTTYRTRGAVSWAYQEGPEQRTVVGRIVGDVSQRFRDRIRFLQRTIGYEVRPVALLLDEDCPEDAILCRQTAGNEQDNAAWYTDVNGIRRPAGDLSLTFVEEV